jgi:protein associated with RNAse G/E
MTNQSTMLILYEGDVSLRATDTEFGNLDIDDFVIRDRRMIYDNSVIMVIHRDGTKRILKNRFGKNDR